MIAGLTLIPANLGSQQAAQTLANCPITQPTKRVFVPPAPFPTKPPSNRYYLGSEKLWTLVWDGPWHGVPGSDGALRVKLPWFAAGLSFKEQQDPEISVTGRRMDAAARPLEVEGPSNAVLPDYYFFASTLVFSANGCWEISAQRKDTKLMFIVFVTK